MDLIWRLIWTASPIVILMGGVAILAAVFGDALARRYGNIKAKCPKCRYDMAGLAEFRCPECGHDAGSETALRKPRISRKGLVLGICVIAVGISGPAVSMTVRSDWHRFAPSAILLLTMDEDAKPYDKAPRELLIRAFQGRLAKRHRRALASEIGKLIDANHGPRWIRELDVLGNDVEVAVPVLMRWWDEDESSRARIAELMMKTGVSTDVVVPRIVAVVEEIEAYDDLAMYSIEALGSYPTPESASALKAIADETKYWPFAVQALARMPEHEQLSIEYLDELAIEVSDAGIFLLSIEVAKAVLLGDQPTVEHALVAILADESRSVQERDWAARRLRMLGPSAKDVLPDVASVLLNSTFPTDSRSVLIATLRRIGGYEARPYLVRLMQDQDPKISYEARWELTNRPEYR